MKLRLALRSLKKDKFNSLINILILSLGTIGFLIILEYSLFELSYDKFHAKSNNIHRICWKKFQDGKMAYNNAILYPGVGPKVKEEIPEIENYTRLLAVSNADIVIDKENTFREKKVYYVDSSFFSMFTFPLVTGNRKIDFSAPYNAYITETYANKLFGKNDPIGKMIKYNRSEYQIVGILKDLPKNTHFESNIFLTFESLIQIRGKDRIDNGFDYLFNYLYVSLNPEAKINEIETKLDRVVERYLSHNLKKSNSTSL